MVGQRSFTRRQALSAAGAAAAGVLVATAGSARADGTQEIVGSWFATVTATDPPLGSFASLLSFHDDGTLTESRRLFLAYSRSALCSKPEGMAPGGGPASEATTPSSDSSSSRLLHQMARPWGWTT